MPVGTFWHRRLTRRLLLGSALRGVAAGVAAAGLWPLTGGVAAVRRAWSTAQEQALRWTRLPTVGPRPSPRRDHSLTLDVDRGALYLYGGRVTGPDQGLDDLWRFDLSAGEWAEVPVEGPRPPGRFGHNAVYDLSRGRLVVSLGQASSTRSFDDVWGFDPETGRWARLGTDSRERPVPRYGAGDGYDPAAGRLYISHGFTIRGRFDDTWFFDLASEAWVPVPTSRPAPVARCLLRAVWEPTKGQLLLFGGQSNVEPFHGDFWSLDAGSGEWIEQGRAESPAARFHYGATLDESARQWYLFGGRTPEGLMADLWTYEVDSRVWSVRSEPASAEGPSPRLSADMAWTGPSIILFGGNDGTVDLDDTWMLELG